jgi:hypothetical protein
MGCYKREYENVCQRLMKQAILQLLQDPSVVNEDILNDVRREASRHFREKRKGHI